MSGIDGIFAEMRRTRMEALNEENNKINEENLNEMSREEEKDVIKKARPIIQKIAYAAKVKVKNPGQNSSRFIIVGDGAAKVASDAAKAVKEALKDVEGFEDLRVKAAGVSAADKEKYKLGDSEVKAVIVDAPGATNEEEVNEASEPYTYNDHEVSQDDDGNFIVDGNTEMPFATDKEAEEYIDSLKEEDSVNEGDLNVDKKATNGKAFTVEINGKKYSYYPTEESGLTAKELGQKYTKIAKYSVGKALSWLKRNATTPDSYRKKVVNEETINEEYSLKEVNNDLKKLGEMFKKAGYSDFDWNYDDNIDNVLVNFKIKSKSGDIYRIEFNIDIDDPESDFKAPKDKYQLMSVHGDKFDDDECGDNFTSVSALFKGIVETLKYNGVVDEEEVNEEIILTIDADDILKAATAIEKLQAEGKEVKVIQTVDGFQVDSEDLPAEEPEVEEECGSKKDEACNKDEETCPVCGKKYKKGTKCCEEKINELSVWDGLEALMKDDKIEEASEKLARTLTSKTGYKFESSPDGDEVGAESVEDLYNEEPIAVTVYGNGKIHGFLNYSLDKTFKNMDDVFKWVKEKAKDSVSEEVCGKKRKKGKKGKKYCEEKESVNEEVDVAELSARLDECEGSDYMKRALEQGKYEMVKKYLYLKED